MTVWEINDCLDSLVLLVDTRENPRTEAYRRRVAMFEFPYKRQKLDFGDYSAEFTLPSGEVRQIKAAVERKMNLEELSGCLTHDRDRFRAEFQRAKAANASVYLLVENASWENLFNGRYKTKFHPQAFFASLVAWIARYDIKPIFCKKEVTARMVQEILFREAKEQLERGDYG